MTLISIAWRKVSTSSSSTATAWPMPALLTRTSTVPKRSTTSATSRSRSSAELRSRGDREGAGQLADERGQPVLAAGGHDDGRAGGVEHAGEPLAEPARGAGDQGDLAVEAEGGQGIDGEGGGG